MQWIKWLLGAALPLLPLSDAAAGAWTQEAGNGQLITSAYYYQADYFFDNATGSRTRQPTYRKYALSPYFEYGLDGLTTIGGSTSLQRLSQALSGASEKQVSWGLGDTTIFLRRQLWRQGGLAIAAEPLIKLPSPQNERHQPRQGSTHPDAGLGFSAGYGFDIGGRHHYVQGEGQYRLRFGEPKDQLRFSGTLGLAVAEKIIVMPQAFLTYRTARRNAPQFTLSNADDYNLIELQLSALYEVDSASSVQVGAFKAVSGRNAGAGGGVLLGWWRNF